MGNISLTHSYINFKLYKSFLLEKKQNRKKKITLKDALDIN